MKLQKYIIFIILFITALGGYLFFKKTNLQQDKPAFVVGTAAGYAPWVSINAQGEYEGFDVDVMKTLSTAP
ncbi:transporter substrate-binding domain-containing protein [Candidatus Dependentiae bacterium]|nr:transporter substrate-binding domain-containing protein [Candidatus Dependentiae bacterium]